MGRGISILCCILLLTPPQTSCDLFICILCCITFFVTWFILSRPYQSERHEVHQHKQPPPRQFYSFIRSQVITPFQWQRKEGRHFAVLFLVGEKDLKQIWRTEFSPKDHSGNVLVDNGSHIFPQRGHYKNYIAARPSMSLSSGDDIHTEPVLLQELPQLWGIYMKGSQLNSSKNSNLHLKNCHLREKYPSYIVLYSWLFPCSNCTDVIISTMTQYPYNLAEVIVAYTKPWWREAKHTEKNKRRMEERGLRVVKVYYPKWMIEELS